MEVPLLLLAAFMTQIAIGSQEIALVPFVRFLGNRWREKETTDAGIMILRLQLLHSVIGGCTTIVHVVADIGGDKVVAGNMVVFQVGS